MRPDRMLVVGEGVPESVSVSNAARRCDADGTQLPMGIYVFDDGAQVEVMVVTDGGAPATPARIDWTAESHPLLSAYDWMGALWDGAHDIAAPVFEVNSLAFTRGSGQEAFVRGRDYDRGQWWYRIRVDGRTVTVPERDLQPGEPDDDPLDYELQDLDRPRLDELLERIDEDRMPSRFAGVCSLERLRVWSGLEELAEFSPRFDLVIVDEAHAFRNSETRSHALGALLSDWADALIFLSATPLNLGNEDLFSLLQLLAPGEFDNRFVLEQQLEPNAVLHALSASFFEDDVTNAERLRRLKAVESLDFGPAVSTRPEYRELVALLEHESLLPPQIAQAKRLIGQLHALSAVVTRTRKVEVQERKAVREAVPIPVEWTDREAEFYAAFERWQIDRARTLGLPVGFVTQMPLRLASTCLPAARDRVLNWRDESGDEDLDATDDDISWDITNPPAEVLALAQGLGEVDTKFDAFRERLRQLVEDDRRVLVFTFSRRALAYLSERLSSASPVHPRRVSVTLGS